MKVIVYSILFILVFSIFSIPNLALGQLESLTISGPKRILKDAVFSFHVDIEGISRQSYGDFSIILEIAEKESGNLVHDQAMWLLPGKNTITFSGKEYATGVNKVTLNPGVIHVIRINHLNFVWEYEFLAVNTVEELSEPKSTANPQESNLKTSTQNQTQIDPPSLELDSETSDTSAEKIPSWVKNTMGWYAEGLISEDEIISAIKFLINEGIIQLD